MGGGRGVAQLGALGVGDGVLIGLFPPAGPRLPPPRILRLGLRSRCRRRRRPSVLLIPLPPAQPRELPRGGFGSDLLLLCVGGALGLGVGAPTAPCTVRSYRHRALQTHPSPKSQQPGNLAKPRRRKGKYSQMRRAAAGLGRACARACPPPPRSCPSRAPRTYGARSGRGPPSAGIGGCIAQRRTSRPRGACRGRH